MEALFSTALASVEAWLMLICVVVFLGVYLLDVVTLAERVMMVLRPAKRPTESEGINTEVVSTNDTQAENTEEILIESPMLEEITPEEIQAHEEEKAEEEQELIAHQEEASELEEEVREAIAENPEVVIENIDKIVEEQIESTEISESNGESTMDGTIQERIAGEEIEIQESSIEGTDTSSLEKPITEESVGESAESDILSEVEIPVIESTEEESRIEENMIESTEPSYEEVSETENKIVDTREVIEAAELRDETVELPESEESMDPMVEEVPEENTPLEKIDEPLIVDAETISTVTVADTTESTEPKEIEKTEVVETVESREKRERERNTERLYAITNEVKTLIARGNTLDARALIIQGLALEKNHRELNVILGSLYESDRQFQKAEYVYKDLALIYPEDVEILEKLANILIIEKRYDIALEIYRKIVSLSGETEGSLYIMTHLSHELGHNEDLYAYAKRYQKSWPNNPEILALLAEAEIALGERQAAIQTLIKLKNLTPYNAEIMETIAKLTMEEELAGNFGGEKI